MFIDSIVVGIFIVSFGGVLVMLVRKIPALNALPFHGTSGIKKHKIVSGVENKIKNVPSPFASFEIRYFTYQACI